MKVLTERLIGRYIIHSSSYKTLLRYPPTVLAEHDTVLR